MEAGLRTGGCAYHLADAETRRLMACGEIGIRGVYGKSL